MIHPYGRQWFPHEACEAFEYNLLMADQMAIAGETNNALRLYKMLAGRSQVAKRRLSLAKRQIKKSLTQSQRNTVKNNQLINIAFIDWYVDFNENENFILELFGKAEKKVIISSIEDADLIVSGCYGERLYSDRELMHDKLVLFVSGENIRPSYNMHDFSLTTEWRSYCGKNVRYPQWYDDLKFEKNKITLSERISKLPVNIKKRDLPITAIYNNSTPLREEVIASLKKAFGNDNIHIFGSQRSGYINKMEILARSSIHVCLENSIGEGYVTEKLHQSLIMGCNSIYWGDKSFKIDFCEGKVYNLYEQENMEDCVKWCSSKLAAEETIKTNWSTFDKTLYNTCPTEDKAIQHIKKICSLITNLRTYSRE